MRVDKQLEAAPRAPALWCRRHAPVGIDRSDTSRSASPSAPSAAREGDLARSRRDLERLRPERERRVAIAL